ncbi:hypothetical protein ACFOSV_13785 [Algoriphagus namhaensis]|uniref:Uncharacterized protein n=1 Tax=Algoriphagus namhaensis TaxID=915353 RepID=A0ABV8ATG8_9BACT
MPDAVSPPRIVIASTLKPVHDTRAWEKFGLSLRETNKYEINIIGFSTKKIEISHKVKFHSSQAVPNSLISRIKAQLIFRKLLLEIRPQLVICCTFEYLPIVQQLKDKIGFRLIYDVQENYILNLSLRKNSPDWKIKLWEKVIKLAEESKAIDHYILAEKCYQSQFHDRKPALVLENKFVGEIKTILPKKPEEKYGYHFVISGTLAESFGTLNGIEFFKAVVKEYPFSRLTIIGQTTVPEFEKVLLKQVENQPQIDLKIDSIPVPHSEIIEAIQSADFLLCPYEIHAAFEGKIPSKFFEGQALGIPILYPKNETWKSFFKESAGGFSIDFYKPQEYLSQFRLALDQVYFLNPNQLEVNWESDKPGFLKLVEGLIQA